MKMIIGGIKADAGDGSVVEIFNPTTGKLIDTVPAATKEDVQKAVQAAKEAQIVWGEYPIHKRAEILKNFISIVTENKEALARLLSEETGKPITQARAEIGNIPIGFSGFIERAKHLYGKVIPNGTELGQENTLQLCIREPIGVVVCIIPFNFPCDLFDQKIAPALMMGNSAIVMPSCHNPLTLIKLTELMGKSGIPQGVLQIVTGPGPVVGPLLISNSDVDFISLTGSTEVGIEAAKNAASHLAHIALELGGNDAFIVLQDADLELAVEEVIWGRMYNTGQVCCASKRFIVHNSIKHEFAEKVVERIKKEKFGDPSLDDTQIGCLVSEAAAIKVENQVNHTVEQGGKIILGGVRKGAFYEPTVIADVTKLTDVAKDMEIFGPVVPIIGFDTVEEAVEIANKSRYGLCGCVFSKDSNTAFKVASKLQCGGAVINGASFFRSFEMPFGGYKYSGIGTEGVSSTLEEMSKTKTIVLKNIFK
jgi:succinate-semialdehyde dehydrogenase/glutarate-semialdehyde dehydrogenase